MEEYEEGDDIDDNYHDHFGDTFMEDDAEGGEGLGEGEEEAHDEPADDLGRTIADARRRCETDKERENLDRMLEDHKKGCTPIAKMATQSSVPYWNCCSGRQRMLCLTKDLRSY